MSDKLNNKELVKITRRDMLKAAGLAAAGFVVGQAINAPIALGAAEVAKQSRPMPYPSTGIDDQLIQNAMYWGAARYKIGGG